MRRDFNVNVRMRDGALLSADVYRPDASARFPVVLARTPYTKSTAEFAKLGSYWTSHGYAFVAQDVRGRGDSAGEFYPLVNEKADGFDTLEWVGTQPWSIGKVGTVGGSYLGWTQFYAASAASPYLSAMIPSVAPPDPDRNFPVTLGVPMPSAAAWLAFIDGHVNQTFEGLPVGEILSAPPSFDLDRRLGRNLKAWQDWVANCGDDSYWGPQRYQEQLLDCAVPMLHVSGWYDDVLVGTLENFVNMTTRARAPGARLRQRLLIGPWDHHVNATRKLGAIDFGPHALVDLDGIQLRWFDRWLKDIGNGVESEPAVRVFVMGRNEWLEAEAWPLPGTRYEQLFLHSRGRANSRNGDGVLSFNAPDNEPPDHFTYDPANPVPYQLSESWGQVGGPDDYNQVELREDVLVYTGPVATIPLLICGPIRVRLYASSSARDTDWTVKLLDVHPDGFAQRLTDGIIRARFRGGMDRERFLIPGQVEEYEIDAWATCFELQPGHRLRLEVASSAQGKFDLNMNTGGPVGRESHGVAAEQMVCHDSSRPSCVLLPIVAR